MILTEYNEELHNRTLREEGKVEGKAEERESVRNIYSILKQQNQLEDFERSIPDEKFREALKAELGI